MAPEAASSSLTQRIGRYDVLGHLAAGGMAEIVLARLVGPNGFERAVVIKRILPHLARVPEFVDMFIDEARIVAGIKHPNVVHVTELGRDGDELYLVMEYLEGESVGGLLRRLWSHGEQLDRTLAAHIVAEACAGLHAAHELLNDEGKPRGLVHRDVSPQNVFITYSGEVKVLDFGIAMANDRLTRTEAGQVKGKFEYMSPEQCLSKPLDRRSDVFALGVILYELTTSHRLFKRDNHLAVLKAITEQDLKPPSSAFPDYPAVLDPICTRALARRARDRYATAADLRRDLTLAMRELGGDGLPEEGLARLMQRLFADRIEDKREMLRRVRAGSGITHIPAAETDGDREVPTVGEISILRSSTDVPTEDRPGKRGAWRNALLGIGFVAMAGVTAASLWSRSRPSEPVAAPPSVEPAAPAPAPSAPAVAESIVLHVETTPPGASVRVGGVEQGATPCDVRVPRGSAALKVEVSRDGFAPLAQDVVPGVDKSLVLSLHPLPRGGAKPIAPAAKPTPTASPDDAYHRFD